MAISSRILGTMENICGLCRKVIFKPTSDCRYQFTAHMQNVLLHANVVSVWIRVPRSGCMADPEGSRHCVSTEVKQVDM